MRHKSIELREVKRIIKIAVVLCTVFLCGPLGAQELLDYPLDTINGEEVYRYEVERSIGLYRIGLNFNVPQSEILRLNPQVKERGLHYGETIYLPTGRKVEKKKPTAKDIKDNLSSKVKETKPAVAGKDAEIIRTVVLNDTIVAKDFMAAADTLLSLLDSIASDSLALDSLNLSDSVVVDERPIVEFALLLPFESLQTKRSGNADRMLEFYQGVLLALHDLQNDSLRYRLRVYDTERSERRVAALCDSTELDSVQGIIGPVYPIQVDRMSSWCYVHDVPLLLPFSDDVYLKTHPTVLQFNSTDQQEADSLCAWIKAKDVHCVTVDAREADVSSSIRVLRRGLKQQGISSSILALRNLLSDSADYALSREKENLIILHSDRFQQVRILLPHLTRLQESGYRIRLLSQYSWQKENITLPQVYASIFTADTDREAYEAQWLKYFGSAHVSESPRYDLLGYDLLNALVDRINGKSESIGLQSTILWQQIDGGGYQNARLKVIEN